MFAINTYNPVDVSFFGAVLLSLILGLMHGIVPDEHTWPITFSYAIGSFSARKGAKAGLIFSSGFTLQRAALSELAYFALASIFTTAAAFGVTYIVVGVAMFVAGAYVANKSYYLHWHFLEKSISNLVGIHKRGSAEQEREYEHVQNPIVGEHGLREVPLRMAFVHGAIAGFGFGAFALILYTVLVPAMPNYYIAWLPGFLFGIGTMIMQIILGTVFGTWLTKVKRLSREGMEFVAKKISSNVLYYGGITFAVMGAVILVYPALLSYGISTGIKVQNIDYLNVGFFIVIFVVVVIGAASYLLAVKKAEKLFSVRKRRAHSGSGG